MWIPKMMFNKYKKKHNGVTRKAQFIFRRGDHLPITWALIFSNGSEG